MKFFTPLALLATTVAATPILSRDAGKPFTLKTTSQNNDHNDLYVYAYHTGAGLNDAVLSKSAGTASSAVLNGTNLQFQLGSGLTFGMLMPGDTNYAGMFALVYLFGDELTLTHGYSVGKSADQRWRGNRRIRRQG